MRTTIAVRKGIAGAYSAGGLRVLYLLLNGPLRSQ